MHGASVMFSVDYVMSFFKFFFNLYHTAIGEEVLTLGFNPMPSSFIMLFPEPVGPRFLNSLLTIKLALRKIHTYFEKLMYLGIRSLYQYETLSACLQDFEDYILVLTPQLCINFEPQRLFSYGNPKSVLCNGVEGHIV
jgi:hypothetical protein